MTSKTPYILTHRSVLSGMQPSIWLMPTTVVNGITYLAVYNPHISRGPEGDKKDEQSFLHFLARRANSMEWKKEAEDSLLYTLNYSAAAKNMLLYFTGHELPSKAVLTHLYHEPTPLFSGNAENKEVHVVHVDLGKLPFVPAILAPSLGTAPKAVWDDKESMLPYCQKVRQNVVWLPLEDILSGVTLQTGKSTNHNICSPSDSPYVYFDREGTTTVFPYVAGKLTKVQQSVLFCLQELSSQLEGKRNRPWISDRHLAEARKKWNYPAVDMMAARHYRHAKNDAPKL